MKKLTNIKVNEDNIDRSIRDLGYEKERSEYSYSKIVTYKKVIKILGKECSHIVKIYKDRNDVYVESFLSRDGKGEIRKLNVNEQMIFAIKALQLKEEWEVHRQAFELEYNAGEKRRNN